MLRENKENATPYEKLYDFQRKHTKTEYTICKKLFCSVFGLMNYKSKFWKNFFCKQFPLIPSTVFKLNDFLTISLFFRLFDNVLIKTYFLYDRFGSKKSSKKTKICGVIVSKWVLFLLRFFLLSQKMNWISYLPFTFYITNHNKNFFLETFYNLDNKPVFEMY